MKQYILSATLLFGIVCMAFALRTFRLQDAPKGALIDEAHFGYLAWSILETGKDEHGVFFPLNFKGFGDDKLPMQVYLMVPVVKFFGMSTATIRYPSIFLGTLLTVVYFFLFRRLRFTNSWAIFAAFLVGVSPWTFILSRFGFESNIALFFFSLGVLGVWTYLDKAKTWSLYLGGIAFGLTWYSYIAYRPITALFILFISALLIWQKKIKVKQAVFFCLTFFITVLPLFHPSVIGNNSTRVSQVGIFTDPVLALEVDEFRNFCVSNLYIQNLCYAVANKYVVAFRILLSRYVETFSPQFMATAGEHTEKFLTVEKFGQFFSVLYPFFILGIVWMIQSIVYQNEADKEKKWQYVLSLFILFGLFVTPIPSVLVGDAQKVRISPLFPFMLMTILLGIRFGYDSLQKAKRVRQLVIIGVMGVFLVQLSQFYVNWFGVHAAKNGEMYQNYLPGLFTYLEAEQSGVRTVIKPFFSDPTMFYAFYVKVPPQEYQNHAVLGELEASGFQHTVQYKNVFVRESSLDEVGCDAIRDNVPAIFVTSEKIAGAVVLYTGYTQNGVHGLVYVYDAPSSVDPTKCSQ